ncbi:TRAP transporter small permease subunit [Pseudomonadota bacterium]
MDTIYRITKAIDALNDLIGRGAAWLAIVMVLLQFFVVMLRYVFSINFIMMQEGVVYLHATLFMLGAAYALLHEGHVRVDIFYRTASPRKKALVDMVGSVFFLLPVCGLIMAASWPYVARSWSMLEGSMETSGIQLVFLLKSLILAFGALMALQGIALGLSALLTLSGHKVPEVEQDEARI